MKGAWEVGTRRSRSAWPYGLQHDWRTASNRE